MPLVAPTISVDSVGATTITARISDASGGTPPYVLYICWDPVLDSEGETIHSVDPNVPYVIDGLIAGRQYNLRSKVVDDLSAAEFGTVLVATTRGTKSSIVSGFWRKRSNWNQRTPLG